MIRMMKNQYLKYLGSFLAGAMLVLAFAPMRQFYFAILAPALLCMLIENAKPKQAAYLGACFGLGQFGAGVSWVFISIHVYGFTPIPIALIFTGLFVGFLALYPTLQCYLLARYFPMPSTQKLLLVFPLSWILIEWLRSWVLTGFPWLLIGFSQINGPLKGYIPLGGEFFVGFLAVFSGVLLVYIAKEFQNCLRVSFCIAILAAIFIGGYFLSQIQWTTPFESSQKVKVILVQGNIPQSIKWDPTSVSKILQIYYELAQENWQTNIMIWPEAAVPIPQNYAAPFLMHMSALAEYHHVSLFTGIITQVSNTFNYYNALISLGEGKGHYYKRHLVPFGEYVPLENLLRGLMGFFNLPMSNLISGPEYQPDLKAKNIIIAPFICYEIAYADNLFYEAGHSQVLLTVSDDAWFGNSLAPAQHLEIGQFRAMQSGRDLLFSGNDGITAIVDDHGNIIQQMPQFIRGVLTGTFQPRTGKTPWLYYGNNPIILLMLFAFLILAICERRKQ